MEDNKCIKCNNSCINNETLEEYYFFGYFYGKNESIFLLRTYNLTNVEDILLDLIRNKINNCSIDISLIDNGNYFYMEAKNTKFIISSSDTEIENIATKIDLGECEEKLKENISSSSSDTNNDLYMLYIEVNDEEANIPITGYEVYYKTDDNILSNIDLGICKDIKINKSVSINITEENIDKYNLSSGYYNDICYTSKTESGTDIILSDRRNEYINNNMAVCEDNCEFIAYDTTTGKATCSCPISVTLSHISNFKLDKEKLKSKFINLKNLINIQIMKCYHLLFSKNIVKNIGCCIISPIIVLGIISIFIFYFYGYNLLKKKIEDIFNTKKEFQVDINKNKNVQKDKKVELTTKNNQKVNETIKVEKEGKNKRNKKNKRKNKNKQGPPKKIKKNNKNKNNDSIIISNLDKIGKTSNIKLKPFSFTEKELNDSKNIQLNEVMKYNDSELNLLSYQEALIFDNRTYCQYYISLLKTKHLLIFSFFNNKDYNSRIIKINLFFFTFAVNYTVNGLFFNDSTMHKIYEDEGEFNFIYQIPQILYSCIISSFFLILVKMLAISEKNVLKIKNSKLDELNKNYKSEYNAINCKFTLFFIIFFILLLLFWYYVGCFCAVYKNTQMHLLSDTLISFVISLSYPLALYLLPGIFRISALKSKDTNKKYMYNLSKIIQLFV